jgi:hypothetical protein
MKFLFPKEFITIALLKNTYVLNGSINLIVFGDPFASAHTSLLLIMLMNKLMH